MWTRVAYLRTYKFKVLVLYYNFILLFITEENNVLFTLHLFDSFSYSSDYNSLFPQDTVRQIHNDLTEYDALL